MHPRIRKRRQKIRRRKLDELKERVALEFASPDSDTEGSPIDHNDHPPVPVRSRLKYLETIKDILRRVRNKD